MRQVIRFFATACYVGYIPLAPGTWGTIVGVGLYWLISGLAPFVYAVTVIAFIIFAIWVSGFAKELFDEVDPPQVVIDEVAGILVTLAFHKPELSVMIMGFIIFRVFDIVKPPPVRWIEKRFSNGFGVVMDDVMAGVYANVVLWVFEIAVPALGIAWA